MLIRTMEFIKKYIIAFLFSASCFGQIDLGACAVNITDGAQIETEDLNGYSNLIMLQSGTSLSITRFRGSTKFIHGYKALEEGDDFEKPTLIIRRCTRTKKLDIDYEKINVQLGYSCLDRPTWFLISIFL